jgi:hypothetical protein
VRGGVPPTPVTVSVKVPRAAVKGTVTIIVDEVVAGLGLKMADAPEGRPVTLKVTGELKPFVRVIVTV